MKTARHTLDRRLKRNVPLIATNEFIGSIGFFFPVTILIFESLTGSYTLAMSVYSVMAFATAFFEIPTGVLSDRWGRRGVLMAGSACEFLGVSCYALAFGASHPLWMLYLGITFYGLARSLFSGNNEAMIHESLAALKCKHQFPKAVGRFTSMGQVGLALGGVACGLLLWAGLFYHTLILLTLIPLAFNLLVAFLTVEPPIHIIEEENTVGHMKAALKLIVKNKKLMLLTLATGLQNGTGFSSYYFTAGFLASVWPTWMIPLYRTGQNGIGAISFWFAGPVVRSLGAIRVLFVGSIVGNILGLAAYATQAFFSPFLLMFTQISYALGTTADRSIQQENFSDAQRATMGSLISFSTSMVFGVSSLILGFLSDLTSPATALIGLLVFKAVSVFWIQYKLYTKHR
ncbi:MAG: MFS transporter [Bdellovibrionales bacterium]|jgi:MFS family permease